jgi:uncharacterized membrane protein
MPWFLAIPFLAIPMLGFANGCRTLTPIAVLCWFAYTGHLHVEGTWASWTASIVSTIVFTVLALGECIGDKLPQTPSRLAAGPLAARIVFGGLVGAIVVTSLHAPLVMGILLGALSAIGGAFSGYHLRRSLTIGHSLPDFPIALAEDAATIGLAFLALHFVTA